MTAYATSADYDPKADSSELFFKTVQNKMHWAAHGHTTAEVIARRADSTQPNMGLTTWTGSRPRRTDVGFAKNYLTQQEIETLNLIVSAYLDFAELQARSSKPRCRKSRCMAFFSSSLASRKRRGETYSRTSAGGSACVVADVLLNRRSTASCRLHRANSAIWNGDAPKPVRVSR